MKAEFAWPGGDRPGKLEFKFDVPGRIEEAIKKTLESIFPKLKNNPYQIHSLLPVKTPAGRYCLTGPDGSYFVRISSRLGNPVLEQSIIQFLNERNVNVNPILMTESEHILEGQKFRIDIRPMINGRHFSGSEEDLLNIAAELGKCHSALAEFPKASEVKASARKRFTKLEEACGLISDSLKRDSFEILGGMASWSRKHRDWLEEMTGNFVSDIYKSPDAQTLHGQVHRANVLFRLDDGGAVLFDFEESVNIFAPCEWDLAYFVQRFSLFDDPPPEVIGRRLEVISLGYGKKLPPLVPLMRQAAWYSIAIIFHHFINKGVVTPLEECNKFVRLEEQARRYEGIL